MRKLFGYFALVLALPVSLSVFGILASGNAGVVHAQDTTVAAKVQMLNGGDKLCIASGGMLDIVAGATVTNAATSTFSGLVTFTGATTTIDTSDTLAVTTADKLTVGGIIVPQAITIPIELWPHASLVTRNLFYADGLAWTVTGIKYEPDIAEGTGSVVCTVCKVTGNNVAVAATTPMCTAFAVTGTAGTPVTATLTATTADLSIATTEKIGCIFSGGDNFLDSGRGKLYITLKRS